MTLVDVNVLIEAFRPDMTNHERTRNWLQQEIRGSLFGMSPQALAALVRITTNRKVFPEPSSLEDALRFSTALLSHSNCRSLQPGPEHWEIFADLCRSANARANLVQDAWFAALAIEHACEWITFDRDYARFPGLRWRTP